MGISLQQLRRIRRNWHRDEELRKERERKEKEEAVERQHQNFLNARMAAGFTALQAENLWKCIVMPWVELGRR